MVCRIPSKAFWENYVDKKSPTTLDNKTKMGLVKKMSLSLIRNLD